MATAHFEGVVPAVYTSIASVLEALKVEKNGVLPGNMGGKPYITAVDISQEVKRQFVENDLIFLPNEEVVKHENLMNNNRLQVSIVIRGEYTIISTQDGSQVAVSGTGDGLATGTAVASNIASTNALKNALLRTFLITEQSVEEAGKNGPAEPAPNRALDNARNTPSAPARPVANRGSSTAARDTIRKDYIDAGKVTPDEVNSMVEEAKASGLKAPQTFEAVLEKLKERA